MGTIVSSLATGFWIEPYVLYKHGFHRPLKDYFKRYLLNTLVFALGSVLTVWVSNLLTGQGILDFILRCILTLLVYNMVMLIAWGRSQEFRYIVGVVRQRLGSWNMRREN